MNATSQDLQRRIAQAETRLPNSIWRPRFHLAPPTGWLNDPNGLCRMGEWYHVFYQYSPFDANGGLKFWGHYRSRDLLNWEQLPVALLPDEPWDGQGVYSGSALTDGEALRLYYTGNVKLPGNHDYIFSGREHNTCLAISRDGGITFPEKRLLMKNSDYPAGLTLHVRDPKVWQEAGCYYMLQGARTSEGIGEALLFTSADGLCWKYKNALRSTEQLGYMWECPDYFRLGGQAYLSASPQGVAREETRLQNLYQSGYFPLDGDLEGTYVLGQFTEFDYGFDFYAPQTFDDNGRRLLIGWMGLPDVETEYINPTAAMGWQHILTVPRELFYREGKLCQRPAEELFQLRKSCRSIQVQGRAAMSGCTVFDLELRAAGGQTLTVVLRNSARIVWENGLLSLTFDRGGYGRSVRRASVKSCCKIRILADESSLEIFVNDGETAMTSRYYPDADDLGVEVYCADGQLTVWEIGENTIDV